jgi:hypothetical protein
MCGQGRPSATDHARRPAAHHVPRSLDEAATNLASIRGRRHPRDHPQRWHLPQRRPPTQPRRRPWTPTSTAARRPLSDTGHRRGIPDPTGEGDEGAPKRVRAELVGVANPAALAHTVVAWFGGWCSRGRNARSANAHRFLVIVENTNLTSMKQPPNTVNQPRLVHSDEHTQLPHTARVLRHRRCPAGAPGWGVS